MRNIPNLLTISNLSLGVLAIIAIFNQHYFASAGCILIAAFIDRFDGQIARRFNVVSAFGKELDSLADMVSFGVAPALLVYMKFHYAGLGILSFVGVVPLLVYVVSGACRLARFNIVKFEGTFSGLPITAAGAILALCSMVTRSTTGTAYFLLLAVLMLAFLMVSRIPIKKV
jgi:CDP-diacylglycerol--serine O-phosphatidyltransferase